MGKLRVLLIQLEFPTWERARSWSYSAQLGIEEGFEANGIDYLTIPAMHGLSTSAPESWLRHVRDICSGKRFDQVWIELVHSNIDETFLQWLTTLASVRIGFLPESLNYHPEEYVYAPHLKERKSLVERRLNYVTHVLAGDEKDAEYLNARGPVRAMWYAAAVPERFIYEQTAPMLNQYAIFCGALYGKRTAWLQSDDLKGLLVRMSPPEDTTIYPRLFDELNSIFSTLLKSGLQVNVGTLSGYLDPLRHIRREIFTHWLESLRSGCAVVNLPHFVKAYAGRVVEAMAAGCPVISWEIPDRPRNTCLFKNGEDILLYPQDNPSLLAAHIQRILREPDFRQRIIENALNKLSRYHTIEKRVQQILKWVETGKEPEYGELEENRGARIDDYYVNLFRNRSYWSTREPNEDEKARWSKVSSLLTWLIQSENKATDRRLRILDVGCGRGWMTNLASLYGTCEGVDPVAGVIEVAQSYFPNLRFYAGNAKDVLKGEDFRPYDIVLTSEVIEHIPRTEQAQFVTDLHQLLKPGGYLILTTPRGEVFGKWMQLTNNARQPVEDWLGEEDLHRLFTEKGFRSIGKDRIFVTIPSLSYVLNPSPEQIESENLLTLYQVWAFQSEPINSQKTGTTSNFPSQVHFLLIDKCNAKCIMCGGDYFRSKSKRLITLEKFKRMASNLRLESFKGIVLAGAGDPLLNPDLIPIIQYINEKYPNLIISITTNGIALSEELSRALLECRIHHINVSINAASQQVYQRIMQVDHFERVCRNVRRFISLRNRKGTGPILQFSSAINRLNIEDLPALVELGREIGTGSINIMYCRFYPERIRHLNLDHEENRLNNEDSLFYHQELSDQMVEKARFLARQYGITFSHEPLFKENATPQPCVWPETQLMVGFDGEIYPCGGAEIHFKEKVEGKVYNFGNALTDPIEKFWNGEMYRSLRISSQSETKGPVPECNHCANRMNPNDLRSHIMQWDNTEIGSKEVGKCEVLIDDKMMDTPYVSVIVPTYNRPGLLVKTLKSILNQTYQNFEILVVNDAGTDVENIITHLNQKGNITYIKHSRNRGLAASRNTGIKVARGKYIAYLDDDDIFYPDHLETLVNFLETSEYKIAYTDAYRAHQEKENGKYVTKKRDVPCSFDFDYDRILTGNFIPVLCFMHEKSCLDDAGLFDELLTTHEDWDLWIRMSRKFKFAHISKITAEFTWRTDGTTMTSEKRTDFLRTLEIIYEKHKEYTKNKPHIIEMQKGSLQCLRNEIYGPSKQIRCSIIIPVFNQAEYTRQCIEALIESTPGELYEVIIIDNGSTDETKEFLKCLEGDVKIITNEQNLGFAIACNQGARAASGKYLIFLNNDTVPQPGWLEEMVKLAESDENIGIVGSKLLFPDGTIQHAGVVVAASRLPYNLYRGCPGDLPAANKVRDFQIVTAACMLIPSKLFFEVGGFNEQYMNGCEDMDLCLKVKVQRKRVMYNPKSVLIHYEGQSDHREDKMDVNKHLLLRTWNNKIEPDDYHFLIQDGMYLVVEADGSCKFVELTKSQGQIKTSIIIVTYNSLSDLRPCLSSIVEYTIPPYEIIIIDNASADGMQEYLKTLINIKIILNKTNNGFTKACNQGIKEAVGEYIVLLNPDTMVTKNWDDRMIAHFQDGVGAVGPISNYVAGMQRFDLHLKENLQGSYDVADIAKRMYQWNKGQSVETKLLIGFCLMTRRDILEKVGLLDETLFLGNDDLELSWRLRGKGYKLQVATDVFIYHKGQASFNTEPAEKTKRLVQESTDRLYEKLEAYYGKGKVPPSEELWGINWFKPSQLIKQKKTNSLTSIIILTYNNLEYTRLCIESIRQHTKTPYELIIVDNGSTDGTVDYLKSLSDVRLILNEKNYGFAVGNNQGMKEARGDYILLLNNDVVVTDDWLSGLIHVAEEVPNVGIVGPRTNYIAGNQVVPGVLCNSIKEIEEFAQRFKRENEWSVTITDRVIGFCMLIKREVIQKIGGFDPRFGIGNFEDDDFCIRARIAGFEIAMANFVFVYHYGSKSFLSRGKDEYRALLKKNWGKFIRKWDLPDRQDGIYNAQPLYKMPFDPEVYYIPFDLDEYCKTDVPPIPIDGAKRFCILSIPDWWSEKGEWSSVIDMYINTFNKEDETSLILYVDTCMGDSGEEVILKIKRYLNDKGLSEDEIADIVLLATPLPFTKRGALFKSADLLVTTETFMDRLHAMEALRCGTPVVHITEIEKISEQYKASIPEVVRRV